MQVGDRVRCKATGAGYTVLAAPNGPDVLVRNELAGGVYFVAVEGLKVVLPCKQCGGTGIWMRLAGFSAELRGLGSVATACPVCQPEVKP